MIIDYGEYWRATCYIDGFYGQNYLSFIVTHGVKVFDSIDVQYRRDSENVAYRRNSESVTFYRNSN